MKYSRVEQVLVGAMILLVAVAVAAVAGCSERRDRTYYITGPGAPADTFEVYLPGDPPVSWVPPGHRKHKHRN